MEKNINLFEIRKIFVTQFSTVKRMGTVETVLELLETINIFKNSKRSNSLFFQAPVGPHIKSFSKENFCYISHWKLFLEQQQKSRKASSGSEGHGLLESVTSASKFIHFLIKRKMAKLDYKSFPPKLTCFWFSKAGYLYKINL